MANGIFKLYKNDWIRGIVLAVISALLVVVAKIALAPNFDAWKVDWADLGHQMVNTSVTTFVAYLVKNFLTTSTGSFLNITPDDKPTV